MHYILKYILLLTILVSWCLPTKADEGSSEMRCVSIDEGLAGDCVYSILKDSRGLTWVGTNNGICLYDGQHTYAVSCDARRSMNLVHDLAELPDGNIVAGMRAGLYVVSRKTLVAKQVCCQLKNVRTLLVVGDSLLAGSSNGLMLVDLRKWQATPVTLGSSRIARDNQIADLCTDGQGGAWVMSPSTLYHLDKQLKAVRVEADFSTVRDGLRRVCAVGQKVYIGTRWQGLLCYDASRQRLQSVEAVSDGVIADLNCDGSGRLFVALDGSGALTLDSRTDTVMQRYEYGDGPQGLPSNSVYTFWQEAETGLAFFGFYRQGMAHSMLHNPIIETYRHGAVDSHNLPVRSFCIESPWTAIGTRDGLWLVNEQTDEASHFGSDTMGGSNVLSIAWFAGRFVVATFDGGLCYIDPQTTTVTRPEESVLRNGNFTKVSLIPNNGNTAERLMAISDRVIVLDRNLTIQALYDSRNSELGGNVLTDFLFDETGKAWLSGADGIALYDPVNGVIQRTGFPEGFFNTEVAMRFALDWNGDVLAVSENNLYRSSADINNWDSIDIVHKLDVGSISFIAPRTDGYWIGTDRGLFLMDSLFTRFRHYGKAEGLTSLFCNSLSWQRTTDGSFWFTTDKGLHRLKESSQALENRGSSQVPLFLNSISLDSRTLPPAECLNVSEERCMDIGWNFGQEPVSLTVTPLNYADGRATYLEWNIDDDEMEVTTERRPISISGLLPGRHRLHIYMPGDTEPQVFTFSVWPSQAFWFEIAFTIMVLISIPLMMQYQQRVMRAKALRRRKRKLEMELHAQEAVKRHIKEEEEQQAAEEEARRAAMYQRSRSSQEEYRRLLREMKRLMEDEHPYRQTDLRVADVAQALHTTPNKLSQMLSQHAEVTFYDFINDYRIEEFKRRATDSKYSHLSTLAIAEKCGFKKTTFYAAFAKKEGCTPSEWLGQQKQKKQTESSSKHIEHSSD